MLTLLLALAACSGDDLTAPETLTEPNEIAEVIVEPPAAQVVLGDSIQLTASALNHDQESMDAEVEWSSLDPAVATVDETGRVWGESAGSAGIVATAGQASDTASISVPRDGTQPAVLPELPRNEVDTRYVEPSGEIIQVSSGDDLQAALDAASPGDILELEAGATWTGPIRLPEKSGDEWIVIRSNQIDQLPPEGSRVSPDDAVNMPKILAPTGNQRAIETVAGEQASHYRFVGIEIGVDHTENMTDLIRWGSSGSDQSTAASAPHHLIIDRCYVRANDDIEIRRGLTLNSATSGVVDSYFENFHHNGGDAQAILGWNGPGPFRIHNNYLEGSGENVMFGGADAQSEEVFPQDITITRNHFHKPPEWHSSNRWSVKNLLELKNAQRVLIEGNVFENNWPDSQTGKAILFKSVNQGGGCPACVTEDVTFRYNVVTNTHTAISIVRHGSGSDDSDATTSRILIEHVVFTKLGSESDFTDDRGSVIQMNAAQDITVRHITGFGQHSGVRFAGSTPPRAEGFSFIDNIIGNGRYGSFRSASGNGHGDSALDAHTAVDRIIASSLLVSSDPSDYTLGEDIAFPESRDAVGFEDAAADDYRLRSDSPWKGAASDGTDPGANIDLVEAAVSGVVNP